MAENEKSMIEAAAQQQGLIVKEWKDTDDGLTATFGKYRVTEDGEDEDNFLYTDDEGELTACVVGAARYHNERVCFTLGEIGEVKSLYGIEPVE